VKHVLQGIIVLLLNQASLSFVLKVHIQQQEQQVVSLVQLAILVVELVLPQQQENAL